MSVLWDYRPENPLEEPGYAFNSDQGADSDEDPEAGDLIVPGRMINHDASGFSWSTAILEEIPRKGAEGRNDDVVVPVRSVLVGKRKTYQLATAADLQLLAVTAWYLGDVCIRDVNRGSSHRFGTNERYFETFADCTAKDDLVETIKILAEVGEAGSGPNVPFIPSYIPNHLEARGQNSQLVPGSQTIDVVVRSFN